MHTRHWMAAMAFCGVGLLSSPSYSQINTYSEGYRMGMLTKWSLKGYVLKTGEGELLLGNDSTPWVKQVDGKPKTMNPWAFSSDRATTEKYQALLGTYVVIHYEQIKIQLTSWTGDTDYRVLDVTPIDPNAPAPEACGEQASSGGFSDGARIGRLVKVSTKGNVFKSWEAILQLGNAGGQFLEVSIQDPKIFECANAFLKTGKRVKLNYDQSMLRNHLARDTTYDIIGLAPVASLN